jgi:hypothetical protein
LKHLTGSELVEWVKHLPADQTFTVSIVAENAIHQPSTRTVNENKNTCVNGREIFLIQVEQAGIPPRSAHRYTQVSIIFVNY